MRFDVFNRFKHRETPGKTPGGLGDREEVVDTSPDPTDGFQMIDVRGETFDEMVSVRDRLRVGLAWVHMTNMGAHVSSRTVS